MWAPEGGEIAEQESAVWALKERLVLIRAVNLADQGKSLWIATYDPQQNVMGIRFQGTVGRSMATHLGPGDQ